MLFTKIPRLLLLHFAVLNIDASPEIKPREKEPSSKSLVAHGRESNNYGARLNWITASLLPRGVYI